jgi:hypothetical protein
MLEQQFIAEYIDNIRFIDQFALPFADGHTHSSTGVRQPARRPLAQRPPWPVDGPGLAPL